MKLREKWKILNVTGEGDLTRLQFSEKDMGALVDPRKLTLCQKRPLIRGTGAEHKRNCVLHQGYALLRPGLEHHCSIGAPHFRQEAREGQIKGLETMPDE